MLSNYVKTFINQMSRRTGTVLTDMHSRILEFAYTYYKKHRVGPLYKNIERYTGATKEDIELLFPHGLNSVYSWIGIPIHSINEICKPIADVYVEKTNDIYFDHNATTCVRKEVQKILHDYYSGKHGFGNPSSSTTQGQQAFDTIMQARREVAECINVKPSEITFVSCGSEANNMAIKGVAFKYIETKGHIITSQIEHPSVIESVHFLGMFGFNITFLDVDKNGLITVDSVKDALRSDTILVSIMAVNNEVGTINPISEIGNVCRLAEVPFMVDAIQAFGKMELHPKKMGISLMSISGHKIYAPKGIGALYVDETISLVPLIHGGIQEFNRRAGTENIGHIMALGKATKLSVSEMAAEMKRLTELRDYFLKQLEKNVPGHIINGSIEQRLPTNLSVGFPDVDSGALLLSLNKIGIFVSAGSACSAGSKEASSVIKALGVDTDKYGIIRFSFGLNSSKSDVDFLFKYLPEIIEQIRNTS